MNSPSYTATPHKDPHGELLDVQLLVDGKLWRLAGRAGPERERSLLRPLQQKQESLPVLLGAGMGYALEALFDLHKGPLAVVDKEESILELTRCRKRFQADNLLWVNAQTPGQALKELSRWQMKHDGLPLLPLPNPVYLRLDPAYYRQINEQLSASKSFDFWAKARYARFASPTPRMLLLTSSYFLMGEIIAACHRLDVPHRLLSIEEGEVGTTQFVESLLKAVIEFKPDFVFTINHLGVDREGVLMDMLARLELPLASWFVDNPHLILYLYNRNVSPITSIFTWDADNLPSLKAMGFEHVHYLPLGTDVSRFAPPAGAPAAPEIPVSFVGNSMQYKVGLRLKAAKPGKKLLQRYKEIAAAFSEDQEPSVQTFLAGRYPELLPEFEALDTVERRLAFEAMITWESTRQYRRSCVEQLLPFSPLIVGDTGWKITFKNTPHPWRWHPELNYYTALPNFYPRCAVNFNCTSKQMKGAVNQRVFDVPAATGFVLSDWREQIERLFEPGREVICYQEPEEIPELLRHYLDNPGARQAVAQAARRRILAEHTYEHRVQSILTAMRKAFA